MSSVPATVAPTLCEPAIAPGVKTPRESGSMIVKQPADASVAMFDAEMFSQMQRVAAAIGGSSLVPKHLVGRNAQETVGNCLRVVNQAYRWGLDPYAVADESYVVHGKLGYQGKLVAAVVNTRVNLKCRPQPFYNSEAGDKLAVVIYGSGSEITESAFAQIEYYANSDDKKALGELTKMGVMCVRLSVGQAKTDNSMWKKDPEQKLFYSGVSKWTRRYFPEVILGILTDHDLEVIKEAPQHSTDRVIATSLDSVSQRLEGKSTPGTQEEPCRVEPAEPAEPAAPAANIGDETMQFIKEEIASADAKKTTELYNFYVGADSPLGSQSDIDIVSGWCKDRRELLEREAESA